MLFDLKLWLKTQLILIKASNVLVNEAAHTSHRKRIKWPLASLCQVAHFCYPGPHTATDKQSLSHMHPTHVFTSDWLSVKLLNTLLLDWTWQFEECDWYTSTGIIDIADPVSSLVANTLFTVRCTVIADASTFITQLDSLSCTSNTLEMLFPLCIVTTLLELHWREPQYLPN